MTFAESTPRRTFSSARPGRGCWRGAPLLRKRSWPAGRRRGIGARLPRELRTIPQARQSREEGARAPLLRVGFVRAPSGRAALAYGSLCAIDAWELTGARGATAGSVPCRAASRGASCCAADSTRGSATQRAPQSMRKRYAFVRRLCGVSAESRQRSAAPRASFMNLSRSHCRASRHYKAMNVAPLPYCSLAEVRRGRGLFPYNVAILHELSPRSALIALGDSGRRGVQSKTPLRYGWGTIKKR